MNEPARYREFRRDELSPMQQAAFDQIAAPRGGVVPAPFHVLLESPELASLTQALGAFCRYRTGLAPCLSELLVLVTAVHWHADYELAVHVAEARKAGIAEETIDAIRRGIVPRLDDPDSQLVYEFATAFYAARDVPDEIFQKAVARFGRAVVVELVGVLAYYSLLAIVIRAFRVRPTT